MVDRIAVESIRMTDGKVLAVHVPAPDHIDMDSKSQKQMMVYIKEITYELSAHFKGSEHYVKEIKAN